MRALKEYNVKNLVIAGGVSANSGIRNKFTELCRESDINLTIPNIKYCTDNAAMIGTAGYYSFIKGVRHGLDLNAIPNLKIGERL